MKFFTTPNTYRLLSLSHNEYHGLRNAKVHSPNDLITVFVPKDFDEEKFLAAHQLDLQGRTDHVVFARPLGANETFAFRWQSTVEIPADLALARAKQGPGHNILTYDDDQYIYLDMPEDGKLIDKSVGCHCFSDETYRLIEDARRDEALRSAIGSLEAALTTRPESTLETLQHGELAGINRVTELSDFRQFSADMDIEGKLFLRDQRHDKVVEITSTYIEEKLLELDLEGRRSDEALCRRIERSLKRTLVDEELTATEKELAATAKEYIRLRLFEEELDKASRSVSDLAGHSLSDGLDAIASDLSYRKSALALQRTRLNGRLGKTLTGRIERLLATSNPGDLDL